MGSNSQNNIVYISEKRIEKNKYEYYIIKKSMLNHDYKILPNEILGKWIFICKIAEYKKLNTNSNFQTKVSIIWANMNKASQ